MFGKYLFVHLQFLHADNDVSVEISTTGAVIFPWKAVSHRVHSVLTLPDWGRGRVPACMWAQDHLRGVLSSEIFMLVDGVAKTLSISLYTYDAINQNIWKGANLR